MPTRRYIKLPGRRAQLPFSDAILVNDTLYLSGRIGLDPATGRPPADINEEVRLLLDGFEAVLGEAKMTMNDLVYVQIFCPDVSLWEPFNQAYVKRFSKDFPARAFLGSGQLLFNARFEMQGIAVKG
jgi:2-iminobutanoate/2-iminopropanoate deaminase